MDWEVASVGENARLNAEAAEERATWQEQLTMEAMLSQRRILPAIAACAVGVAVSSLIQTPFGLLAPAAALFVLASGRTERLLFLASAIGFAGSLFVVASYEGHARDLAVAWAAFFALAICIGALVGTRTSVSPGAGAMPTPGRTAKPGEAPSYPVVGPTLHEKAAPRHSPWVGLSAQDDEASARLLTIVSFWGGMPVHLRYWRRQPDSSYRWVESRSEPSREPSGTRLWSSVTAEIDDQRPGQELPTKTAHNPPSDDDAVWAAKVVENLLGNAWAFDAAGRPTYLTPLAQTFVAATLEEFQAVVDEGHAFFKRTAHPDDYDRLSAAWHHSLQTGDPFLLDRRIRRASGIHEWNRTGFVPTRDGMGRITGWYGATIDLDSHRIAEAELRHRERELSQLVAMVPSHIWRLTRDGEPIFFNKRMVDFLGLDVADIDKPGRTRLQAVIEATIHPDDSTGFRSALERCLATGEEFSMRYRLRRVDGAYRWMSSRAEPIRDQDGHIVQWYGLCHDIEDQMRADETLRRSEQRLRQLIDALPAMIWSTSPEGTPTYVNKRFTDVIGATVEDITASDGSPSLSGIIHSDDVAAAMTAVLRSRETGSPYVMQYRQRRRDGSYRWTETRAEPLRSESGSIVQWYGVSVDIHDLVAAQAALREGERSLRELIETAPARIWCFSPEGEPTYWSRQLREFFGFDVDGRDEPGRSRLSTLLRATSHPDDADKTIALVKQNLATGEPWMIRRRQQHRDGEYRWVETHASAMRNADGAIALWTAVNFDIHDLVIAQEALRDREHELAQLVDMLPVYIRRLTAEGEPIFFNKRLTDFIGVGLADIGAPGTARLAPAIENFVHPDEVAKVVAALRGALATGEGYAMRYRMRGADGIYRWIETRAEPLRNKDGTIAQWYSVSIDIEDEVRARQAEETLREISDKLAKATQAASLAELSASIAHEVNQPLAAIVANSHACQRWLSAAPANVERAQITIERITRDANSAAEVVRRIRALFKQSVEPRDRAPLSGAIAEARSLVAEEAARRRVRMEIDVENDLPLVAFDRVQVQQVLINLIRNGMDAMESSAGDRVLGVRVRRMGDVVQTEITDRGEGVEFPDKIFEAFFTTKQNGMGMGLAICRSIVESHGGRLSAEKNEPHGAKFIFTLPIEMMPAS